MRTILFGYDFEAGLRGQIVRLVVVPAVGSIGLFGNLINICIFARRIVRRNAFNLFFLFLAFAHLYLLAAFLLYTISGVVETPAEVPTLLYVKKWTEPLASHAVEFSTWLVGIMVCGRFLGGVVPFIHDIFRFRQRVVASICGFGFLITFICNIPRLFETEIVAVPCTKQSIARNCYNIQPDSLFYTQGYQVIYKGPVWSTFMVKIPLILLLLGLGGFAVVSIYRWYRANAATKRRPRKKRIHSLEILELEESPRAKRPLPKIPTISVVTSSQSTLGGTPALDPTANQKASNQSLANHDTPTPSEPISDGAVAPPPTAAELEHARRLDVIITRTTLILGVWFVLIHLPGFVVGFFNSYILSVDYNRQIWDRAYEVLITSYAASTCLIYFIAHTQYRWLLRKGCGRTNEWAS